MKIQINKSPCYVPEQGDWSHFGTGEVLIAIDNPMGLMAFGMDKNYIDEYVFAVSLNNGDITYINKHANFIKVKTNGILNVYEER